MSTIRSQYQNYIDSGDLTIWMTFGLQRTKDFPNVPSIFELVKTPEDKALADLIFGSDAIGRPIAAPAGMDPKRVKTLRDAFDAMSKDPQYLAESKQIGLSTTAMSGTAVQAKFEDLLKTPKAVIDRAAKAMGR